MFTSFFPNPKIFFPAALGWTVLSVALWYVLGRDLGPTLSVGNLIGLPYPPANANGADVAVQVARGQPTDRDVVDIGNLRTYCVQASLYCESREPRIVLDPVQALLCNGKDNFSIAHQGSGSVSMKHVEA